MRIDIRHLLLAMVVSTTLAACDKDDSAISKAQAAQAGAEAYAQSDARAQSTSTDAKTQPRCTDCGTVVAIKPVEVSGDNSGMGAVIGAAVGGVVGHQLGGGRGKDATTAAGVIGGALAGNAIEKHRNAKQYYAVTVKLDNGGEQTINVASADQIAVGSQVEIIGNNLKLREQVASN